MQDALYQVAVTAVWVPLSVALGYIVAVVIIRLTY